MTVSNAPQKFALYVLPDKGARGAPGHKALTGRRTVKNGKGRYVTGDQFMLYGLFWPTDIAKSRDELAMLIGRAILTEAGL